MATKKYFSETPALSSTIWALVTNFDDGDGFSFDSDRISTTASTAFPAPEETQFTDDVNGQPTGQVVEWVTGETPAGGFTLSGTMNFGLRARESNMNADMGLRIRVYRRTPAGVYTEVAGGPFDDGVELSTTNNDMTWSGTPSTGLAFAEGDRIAVRIYGEPGNSSSHYGIGVGFSEPAIPDNIFWLHRSANFFEIAENVSFLDPLHQTVFPLPAGTGGIGPDVFAAVVASPEVRQSQTLTPSVRAIAAAVAPPTTIKGPVVLTPDFIPDLSFGPNIIVVPATVILSGSPPEEEVLGGGGGGFGVGIDRVGKRRPVIPAREKVRALTPGTITASWRVVGAFVHNLPGTVSKPAAPLVVPLVPVEKQAPVVRKEYAPPTGPLVNVRSLVLVEQPAAGAPPVHVSLPARVVVRKYESAPPAVTTLPAEAETPSSVEEVTPRLEAETTPAAVRPEQVFTRTGLATAPAELLETVVPSHLVQFPTKVRAALPLAIREIPSRPPRAKKKAVQARRVRALPRRIVSFQRLVKQVADRYGVQAATSWTKAVLGYQARISEAALRSAIASGNVQAIEGVIGVTKMQQVVQKAIQNPLLRAAQTVGQHSARMMSAYGIEMTFQATHPNVVLFARQQAAELVADVPKQVKQIIAEVIARGAERGLTVAEQATAIREVVGLPPNWAHAPHALAQEIRDGNLSAATSRRLSAKTKQQIRSAVKNGTANETFIRRVTKEYTASLVNRRALNIARTETLKAANHGLLESWNQAKAAGDLPANTRRFWIVTPDDRLSEEHARIPGMNPDGRGLNESFVTPDGVFMYPPTRPNCRCAVGLGFPVR